MAEVTGTIGNEYVELNNAATEATLQKLLASMALANKQSIDQINKMATKMGLDPTAIAAANRGLQNVATGADQSQGALSNFSKVGNAAADVFSRINRNSLAFADKLTKGQVGLSEFISPLEKLPGLLGVFGQVLTRVAAYQEANIEQYQKITQVGANFGGSLTDLRQAAINSYMTLDQFGNFVKSNGEALARMGGSVDQGTRSFSRLSKDLIGSELGTRLMALGYSTEQINGAMASYIASTGGRTRQEMQNTQALAAATSSYMTELDALTQFTGVSKDKLAEEAKKAAQNEAFQRKLASMDEAERVKLKTAYDKAAASGITGATDLVMSTALGLPPVTKAAQTLSGVAPQVASGLNNMTKTAMDGTKTLKDVDKENGKILLAASNTSKSFGKVSDAIITQGGEYGNIMNSLGGAENKLRSQGIASEEQYATRQAEIRKNIEDQGKSQAADMAKANKAISEIGQVVNNIFAPAISILTTYAAKLTEKVAGAVKWFDSLNGWAQGFIVAGLALTAWAVKDLAVKKAKDAATAATDKAKALADLQRGASISRPLYVTIVGKVPGSAGGGGTGGAPGGGAPGGGAPGGGGTGGAPGGGGKTRKFGKLAGGAGALLGGVALDVAQEKLIESGHETLGAAAGIGSAALTGAGMGAMLGPWGALAGGLLGAGYGAYQNFFGENKGVPKAASGGIVSKPTLAMVGEGGESEAIIPLSKLKDMLSGIGPASSLLSAAGGGITSAVSSLVSGPGNGESLKSELQTLNKQSAEMLKYLKETAEYTRRTVDATRSLGGDLFR